LLPALVEAQPPAPEPTERELALQLAQSGDLTGAREELQRLHLDAADGSPEATELRHDLARIEALNGNHAAAVDLIDPTPLSDQPDDVLAVYAESLHLSGNLDEAVVAYRQLAGRQPEDPKAALGMFYALMDTNHFDEAARQLENNRHRIDEKSLAFATAYLATAQKQRLSALREYNRVLKVEPGNRQALRGKALSALALGAPWQALAISEQYPGVLSEEEHQRVVLDTAAMQLRWSSVTAADQAEQIATTETAIDVQDDVLGSRDLAELDVNNPIERALLFDRIVALQQRFEMSEAIDLFEATVSRIDDPDQLPLYVLKVAGDAHLYLRQPIEARDLYLEALNRDPSHYPSRMGLFFAYSDYGEHEKAQALLDQTLETQPAWIRPTPRIWLQNPAFANATQVKAVSPAYAGDYDTSLDQLDDLLAIAPASHSTRVSRAQVLRWRGWPRAAQIEVGRTLGEVPGNVYAGTTNAHTLMDVYRFEEAGIAVSGLDQTASHDPGVRSVVRRWQLHRRPELITEASFRSSDGDAVGTDEWRINTLIFSSPIADNYRVFAHDFIQNAEFSEGTGRDHRLGVGVEYRESGVRLASELSTGFEQNTKAGLSLDGDWQIDDFWSITGRLAANSQEVPLRGTRVGVRGDEITLGGAYRWHEARRLAGRAMMLDMNDGNRRQSLDINFTQRLRNGARHRLHGLLEGYTSSNTEENTIYFNPESDWSVAAGLEHEWVVHRRYERGLVQKLGFDLGNYWQSGYGSGTTWTIRFEHGWQFSDALSLNYGASTGVRIYDGEKENTNALFFSLVARL